MKNFILGVLLTYAALVSVCLGINVKGKSTQCTCETPMASVSAVPHLSFSDAAEIAISVTPSEPVGTGSTIQIDVNVVLKPGAQSYVLNVELDPNGGLKLLSEKETQTGRTLFAEITRTETGPHPVLLRGGISVCGIFQGKEVCLVSTSFPHPAYQVSP